MHVCAVFYTANAFFCKIISIKPISIKVLIVKVKKVMFAEKYRSIGLNILYYRRLKGLSQEALSIKAGLTRSYISKIERGAARCGLEVFFLIAQALEVDPAELISDLPPGTESAQK